MKISNLQATTTNARANASGTTCAQPRTGLDQAKLLPESLNGFVVKWLRSGRHGYISSPWLKAMMTLAKSMPLPLKLETASKTPIPRCIH